MTTLGRAAQFTDLPAPLRLAGQHWFLDRDADGHWRLLSATCPHMQGLIGKCADGYHCPSHGWRFTQTGDCLTTPGRGMSVLPVEECDGVLRVALPRTTAPPRAQGSVSPPPGLSITLHAHACLEIRHTGFSLLTDPWLTGTAMMGSWMHYPPVTTKIGDLKPDAILITHEHSDHFHPPTLSHFDRSTPIYVPDFPNRRLPRMLGELGFERVIVLRFGEPVDIGPHGVTAFEPGGLWNDSSQLIETAGWRLMNLNDSGLNRRVAQRIGPVDAVASSFSSGASGYPATWTHLSDAEKARIMERNCRGLLDMLEQALDIHGTADRPVRHILPYAGHFVLGHPSHAAYARAMKKNTVMDVVEALAHRPVKVLDLLAGETWHGDADRIDYRWKQRDQLYDRDRVERYTTAAYRREVNAESGLEANSNSPPRKRGVPGGLHAQQTPPLSGGPRGAIGVPITDDELTAYFLRLNQVPEIIFCEDVALRVRITGERFDEVELDRCFAIEGGRLHAVESLDQPNLTMDIPRRVMAELIRGDASWDEAHIGYWCRFHRQPDVFHAHFWRLLQAPYYAKPADLTPPTADDAVTAHTTIAELLEAQPETDRILRRYGLYCVGCQHSTQESLRQGAAVHGIDRAELDRLIAELNAVMADAVGDVVMGDVKPRPLVALAPLPE